MKYRLTFRCDNKLILPINYYNILQAAILNWLNDVAYQKFLHDTGYCTPSRKYKLYTFSNIYGTFQINKQSRKIMFEDEISIYLSFFTEDSHQLIVRNYNEKRPIKIGNTWCSLVGCEIAQEKYEECVVDTVSPITIHSTLENKEGKKKTYYYEPTERDFSEMIRQNLIRKYVALDGNTPCDNSFKIIPVGISSMKKISTHYRGFVIKGWLGQFRLTGSEEMIKMALLSGIGARNSIGFGCVLQRNDM